MKEIDLGLGGGSRPKILVVDDDPQLLSIVQDALMDEYEIVKARNGREGVARAESSAPDLILMDIVMPDLGGYEAARALQNNPATGKIPVLIFTAQDFDSSTIEMIRREPNVVGFIRKPFRPKGLRETVRMALQKKNA